MRHTADFAFTADVLRTIDAVDLYDVCGVTGVDSIDVDDAADVVALVDAIAHYRDDTDGEVFANTVTMVSRRRRVAA